MKHIGVETSPGGMSIADRLALMRTGLANERTLLAYVRTAVTFAAGGIGLARLVTDPTMIRVGWALFPLGLVVMIIGVVRFRQMRRLLADVDANGGMALAHSED